jgi:hypothetical protein
LLTTALGCELWARHLFRISDFALSRRYFSESLQWYREYGASRKVEHLESEVKERFAGKSDVGPGFSSIVNEKSSSRLFIEE